MGSDQIHDFNPGIEENGLFWTTAVNPHEVAVNPGTGSAIMDVRNLETEDYHDFANAVLDGPSLEGLVSFRVEWARSHDTRRFRNVEQQYDANMVLTSASCAWTGETSDARYVSDPGSSISVYAQVGQMRNGVFFS